MKKIEVVAAILYCNNKILCVQRPNSTYTYISNKFEFPGGKIEKGESNVDALKREILEELNITIDIKSFFMTVNHQYPDFELIMHSYICHVDSDEVVLTEHISLQWLDVKDLNKLDWAAADIPIVDKLILNG